MKSWSAVASDIAAAARRAASNAHCRRGHPLQRLVAGRSAAASEWSAGRDVRDECHGGVGHMLKLTA